MIMGLLKSVDNSGDIDFNEYRDQDYYNRYKYRARLTINGIRFLYYVKNIEQWTWRITGNETDRTSWYADRMTPAEKDRVLQNKDIIEKIINYKSSLKKGEAIVRQEGNTLAVFSNDLSLLLIPKSWNTPILFDITECVLGEYSGTKYFVRQPKHKYRVYLKSKRVDRTVISEIRELLSKHPNLIPSKGLEKWLDFKHKTTWKSRYCSSSYSIDYNDESMLSYLALCYGDLLGKKYKLEKRELPQ